MLMKYLDRLQLFRQWASLPEHSFSKNVCNPWFTLSKVYAFTSTIKQNSLDNQGLLGAGTAVGDSGYRGFHSKERCLNLLPWEGLIFPSPSLGAPGEAWTRTPFSTPVVPTPETLEAALVSSAHCSLAECWDPEERGIPWKLTYIAHRSGRAMTGKTWTWIPELQGNRVLVVFLRPG